MKPLQLLAGTLVLITLFYSCDKNEYPPETSDQDFSVEENSPVGTVIGTIAASDEDEGQVLSYEIIDGNEDGAFDLDNSSGSLTVAKTEALDYEETQEYQLTIAVNDNHRKEPLETSAEVVISVLDVNEFSPVLADQVFSIAENSLEGTSIGSIEASDQDTEQVLSYAITEGNADGIFSLDASTGMLQAENSDSLDYEKTEQYILTVTVSDNHPENPLTTTAEIQVDIENVNEIPHNGMQAFYACIGNTNDYSGNNYNFSDPGLDYGTDRKYNENETFNLNGSMGLSLLSQLFNNQSQPQTISLWFKTTSPNSVDYGGLLFGVLGRGAAGSGSRFLLSMKEGLIRAGYGDEWADDNKWNENLESVMPYNDGHWHHVVFITNGDDQTASLIIDNELIESRTLVKSNHNIVSNIDFKIGGDKAQNYFTGELDEIIYYHRALSLDEVEAIYVEK